MEINVEELKENVENAKSVLEVLNGFAQKKYDINATNLYAFLEYEEIMKETGNVIIDLKTLVDKDLRGILSTVDAFEDLDESFAEDIDKA